jgi:Zn-dependent protease with chaperone function
MKFLKKIVLLIVSIFFIGINSNAQVPDWDLNLTSPITIVCKKKFTNNEGEKISEGQKFSIQTMRWEVDKAKQLWICMLYLKNQSNNLPFKISQTDLEKFNFEDVNTPDKVWNETLLRSDVFPSISKRGLQYDIRNSMHEDAEEYINKLIKAGQIYKEDFFEDYLYTLSTKIHPGVLNDGRQGNISLYILDNVQPQAFCLSNGTIIISTGMLSSIQSEDELVGVIAHEVAHFVLDHQILNKNLETDRKKRAEFWASFATTIAGAADVYLASKNRNHPAGALTYSVAMASILISQAVVTELGLKYSQEQEKEADKVANEILSSLKYDKLGLKIALRRIKDHFILTGNFIALTGSGSHPDLYSRIGDDGEKADLAKFSKSDYLIKSSIITSSAAEHQMFDYAHHLKAIELVDRNINNKVAIESDYLIKAIATRRLSNSKESNEYAVKYLEKASAINISNDYRIYKHLGISHLRLDNKIEAKKAFTTYIEQLNNWLKKYENDIHTYKEDIEFVNDEILWTKKMFNKIEAISAK